MPLPLPHCHGVHTIEAEADEKNVDALPRGNVAAAELQSQLNLVFTYHILYSYDLAAGISISTICQVASGKRIHQFILFSQQSTVFVNLEKENIDMLYIDNLFVFIPILG